ncbi:MAG TPA: DNA polymerase III subunit beta [Candidatus Eisenbacteria bacterium]|jgi:DNA polymerase-3 subunit beta|nr:DNA polymerase III subunit beta [Candidatus Eisenbacteria bacterium]
MKFSCTQENLNQGLAVVSHIASKNVNLPILGNVLIKGDDKMLRFMTTNLEIAIRCVVRGKIEAQGEFTVPSKLFADYVSLLPKDRVDVELDGNALTVACGTYQTKLNGIAASEFPLIPTIEGQQKFTVKVEDLRKAVSQVLFAVAPNESRPEISGVLFKFTPSSDGLELVLAATDSYRLAEKIVPVNKAESTPIKEAASVIVPSRTVAELIRILGVFKDSLDNPKELQIHLAENQILFAYDTVELISRTIEGKYPDYRQLIPERFESEVVVSKDELARAVKTASLFSRTGLNDIHLTFTTPASVRLASTNAQTGEHAVDLDGAIQGKSNAITVNFRYFLDGVNNVESENVILQLIDGMSPCLVRGYGEGQASMEYLYIVMPIRQ